MTKKGKELLMTVLRKFLSEVDNELQLKDKRFISNLIALIGGY